MDFWILDYWCFCSISKTWHSRAYSVTIPFGHDNNDNDKSKLNIKSYWIFGKSSQVGGIFDSLVENNLQATMLNSRV